MTQKSNRVHLSDLSISLASSELRLQWHRKCLWQGVRPQGAAGLQAVASVWLL